MNTYKKIGIAAFMTLGAFQLNAQDVQKQDPTEKFAQIDADKSGQINLQEMMAYKQQKWKNEGKEMTEENMAEIEKKFQKLDSNEDGNINLEEFMKAMKEEKKMKKKEKVESPE